MDVEEGSSDVDDAQTEDFRVNDNSETQTNNIEDSYMFQVLSARSIVVLDPRKTCFLIQDFDMERKLLMRRKFCILKRVAIQFDDDVHWLYCCDCNRSRSKFVSGISTSIEQQYPEFLSHINQRYPDCLHIKVCKVIADSWEQQCGVTQLQPEHGVPFEHVYSQELPDIIELPFSSEPLLCVRPPGRGFGVVSVDRRGFVCISCKEACRFCYHVKSLGDFVNNDEMDVPDFLLRIVELHASLKTSFPCTYNRFSVSSKSIEVNVSHSQRSVFNGFLSAAAEITDCDSMRLKPDFDGDNCKYCRNSIEETVFWDTEKKFFTMKNAFIVTVPYRKCSHADCGRIQCYDGCSAGILNMGDFLVGHDVLRDYFMHYVHGHSCSLVSYLEIWKCNLDASGFDTSSALNYQQWRMTWYSFLRLLAIDYESGFLCEKCGQYPNIILCDATSLGYRRKFATSIQLEDTARSEHDTLLKGSSFQDRVFVVSEETRKLLKKMVTVHCSASDRSKLNQRLLASHPILHRFLIECEDLYGGRNQIPPGVLSLIRCISSDSPVCSYVPCSTKVESIIQRLSEGLIIRKDPNCLSELQYSAPVLFAALQALPETPLSNTWIALLKQLYYKGKECFTDETHDLGQPRDADRNKMSFFPAWKTLCERGKYRLDTSKKNNPYLCSKSYRGHPNLLPGIFTVYCEHEICYGFQVMETPESVNVPFTILRTRFPTAPEAVIYDNCCHLHQYCLNRDPTFFKNCSFLVDRFHWKNHTGCADSYNISLYPAYEKINTQVNEQKNSTLKVLKSQLSYMNEVNFINHCKIFMWHRNQKTKAKRGGR